MHDGEDVFFQIDAERVGRPRELGRFYGEHVKKIRKVSLWRFAGCVFLFFLVLFWPIIYHLIWWMFFRVEAALGIFENLKNQENFAKNLSHYFFWIYFSGKLLGYCIIVSATVWMARLYNHARKLKIIYKEREIVARTFDNMISANMDQEDRSLARKHVMRFIFYPSLREIENNASRPDIESDVSPAVFLKSLIELCKQSSKH